MDWVGQALGQLRDHFPKMAPVHGAEQSSLLRAEGLGPDADDLCSFYRIANGFDVGLHDDVVGQLLPLEALLETRARLRGLEVCDGRLLPVRSDGCGNYDTLVVGPGPCRGAVVFWDHETFERPSHLLAGTFRSYVRFLVENLVARYDAQGQLRPEYTPHRLDRWPWVAPGELTHPWPFDRDWLQAQDPTAAKLLARRSDRTWLAEYD